MRSIQYFMILLISINIIITFSEILNNNIDTGEQFMINQDIEQKYEVDHNIINNEEENNMNDEENNMNDDEENNMNDEEENNMNDEEENNMNEEEENIMNEENNMNDEENKQIGVNIDDIINNNELNDEFIIMITIETNQIIFPTDETFSTMIHNENILRRYSNIKMFNESNNQNIDTLLNYINGFIDAIKSFDCNVDIDIIDNYKMSLQFIMNKHINLIDKFYMENIDNMINAIINVIIHTDKYTCDINNSEKITEKMNIIKYKLKVIIYNNIMINAGHSLDNLMTTESILFNLNNLLQTINKQQELLLDIHNKNIKSEL